MCGICGEVGFGGELSTDILTKMADCLCHRGPDDSGTFVSPNALLGHRRLSIIDLTPNGRQPMANETGSIRLTFNGEIYNHAELRERLIKSGHVFRSRSDSEVILHLYEEKGVDLLSDLSGMFAFALWDDKRRRLVMARDRLGVKPLVYFVYPKGIVFASEIRSLLCHPKCPRAISPEAMELYFTFLSIPAPLTIYANVHRLQPAHYAIFDETGLNLTRYWKIRSNQQSAGFTGPDFGIRDKLTNAVAERLISDVPVGSFLSGGIDSTIVTALATKLSRKRLKTFHISYPGHVMDESKYAQEVATKLGTEHYVLEVDEEMALDAVQKTLSNLDEPFGDSSSIPQHLVSRMASKQVKVVLSGDGGDEIFGGYRRYLGELYIDQYLKIPKILREQIIAPILDRVPESKDIWALEVLRRLRKFVSGADSLQEERHFRWLAYIGEEEQGKLLLRRLENDPSPGRQHFKNVYSQLEGDRLNRMLMMDTEFLLPNDILTKVDAMSMRNSLEVRSPFLDYRVVEAAFSIPGKNKFTRNSLKSCLKQEFGDLLPSVIVKRSKQGFEFPIGKWLRTSKTFQEMLLDGLCAGFFCKEFVAKAHKEHVEFRRDHTHLLWAVLVFNVWFNNLTSCTPGRLDSW